MLQSKLLRELLLTYTRAMIRFLNCGGISRLCFYPACECMLITRIIKTNWIKLWVVDKIYNNDSVTIQAYMYRQGQSVGQIMLLGHSHTFCVTAAFCAKTGTL